jgi:hypothetical protein
MIGTKSNKKNLVIFTIYFPPVISIASYRLEAYVKYFDKDIFDITVICPITDLDDKYQDISSVNVLRLSNKKHFLKIKFSKNDTFLLHKFKALYNRIFNLFVHDEYKSWKIVALKAFKRINAIQNVDFVISSFPTVAPHLVALQLKKEGFNFKWIADMRDEMSLNPINNYFKKKYFRKVEKKLFSEASFITTTTPGFVNNFKKLSDDKIYIEEIRNGFDFEITDDYNYNNIFTISHTGTFYSNIKPYSFLNAISELLSENKLPPMKIVFIGAGNTVVIPSDLDGIVISTPKIPHEMAIQRIKESDTNLLIVPKTLSKAIPGKLYEYIASQKPVLALVDRDSESAKLVNRCNAGFIADMSNINEIKLLILKTHDLWRTQQRLKVDIKYFKQFHRKVQVKKLEKLLLEKNFN